MTTGGGGQGQQRQSSSSDSSSEADGGSGFTLDDLESLMAEVESTEARRREPALVDHGKKLGPRKHTARKTVQGALTGGDLDHILETIMGAALKKTDTSKHELGWGVVNAHRNFYLAGPNATPIGQVCECTVIVTLDNGERTRIPIEQMKLEFSGMDGIKYSFDDNKDGSYTIKLVPPVLGKFMLYIDAYGKRQYEWAMESCSKPDPATCKARVLTPKPMANQEVLIEITACDTTGHRFKVGGANFQLGFAGVGQLMNTALEDQLDGTYKFRATPSLKGEYLVYISLADVDLNCSPVQFVAY
jgi:hypothetical protein